jgi:hypothetical protein
MLDRRIMLGPAQNMQLQGSKKRLKKNIDKRKSNTGVGQMLQ